MGCQGCILPSCVHFMYINVAYKCEMYTMTIDRYKIKVGEQIPKYTD